MRILVTGSGGLLGGELTRRLPLRGHDVTALARGDLDITDGDAVRRALTALRPDVVVNCAAFAAVDGCQTQPERAFAVNRDGPGHLARAATEVGATLAHISTDYVFGGDGGRRSPYRADDPTAPLQLYGTSKRDGEEAVLRDGERHLVLRVSWLFGGDQAGFVAPILNAARAGRPLRLVSDQWGCPTWAGTVEEVLAALLHAGARGVWHASQGGETTRLEQAREALRLAGLSTRIETVTRAELWPDVPRPAYSVLDLSATEELLGRSMTPWNETLRRYLEELGAAKR
ncbi:MAG TPA: dTDP-4-dehydrorhamnose reductase [Longimicrobiales bacterium]|nr:dTDP-4-dehydrorhamnose reductase [Longimicrobiales bacterium]